MLLLIIRIIYSALETNDIRTAIVGLLKLYSKNQSLKAVLDSENVSEEELDQPYSTFNPNIIKKLLSILKPNELTELKTQLDKLVFKPIKKINNLFKEDKKDIKGKDIEKDNKDDKGWIILSSSWFKKGLFYKSNQSLKVGVLQGLFQSDTSKNKRWYGVYTYPNVPEETWNLMKVQKGKNGNGAGTIFWRYFLRSWLPSQIRKYVKKQLKEQKSTVQLEKESGIAYMYGRTDTDYQLNGYNLTINDNGNIGGWDIKYENNQLLGFCIVNNKNFMWNFYLQSTLGKIEDMWYITGKIGEDDKAYATIHINSIKVNIYKIVLNSR